MNISLPYFVGKILDRVFGLPLAEETDIVINRFSNNEDKILLIEFNLELKITVDSWLVPIAFNKDKWKMVKLRDFGWISAKEFPKYFKRKDG